MGSLLNWRRATVLFRDHADKIVAHVKKRLASGKRIGAGTRKMIETSAQNVWSHGAETWRSVFDRRERADKRLHALAVLLDEATKEPRDEVAVKRLVRAIVKKGRHISALKVMDHLEDQGS